MHITPCFMPPKNSRTSLYRWLKGLCNTSTYDQENSKQSCNTNFRTPCRWHLNHPKILSCWFLREKYPFEYRGRAFITRLQHLPMPVIAAMDGPALGKRLLPVLQVSFPRSWCWTSVYRLVPTNKINQILLLSPLQAEVSRWLWRATCAWLQTTRRWASWRRGSPSYPEAEEPKGCHGKMG